MSGFFSDVEVEVGTVTQKPLPKKANGTRFSSVSMFDAVNLEPVANVLDWLGIEHDGKCVKCPGCNNGYPCDSSCAIVGNAVKCSHNSCADSGPNSAPGLRSNVDLTMLTHGVDKLEAVKMLAAQFGIDLPLNKAANDGGSAEENERKKQEAVKVLTADDIFATPDHIDTLVPGLGIKPGPIVMAVARSGIGKSVILQSACISAALGRPWWGMFPIQRRLKAIWIDLEQGKQTTLLRFKRLALAAELTPDDLRGRLDVSISPNVSNEAALINLFEGYDLAVVDCYRVLAGGIDENDSRAREPLDACARASETTQCAVIVIHHGRKATENNRGGARDVTRGSSAIQDACDAVYFFDRDGDEPEGPINCQCTKVPRATGKAPQPWTLEIQDVDLHESADLVVRGRGLTVVGSRETKTDPFEVRREIRRANTERIQSALLPFFIAQPIWTSAAELASKAHLRKADVLEALAGWSCVETTGKGSHQKYNYIGGNST